MRDLCSLLKSPPERLCRECGDERCSCNAQAENKEARLRRALRDEVDIAFAESRFKFAAFLRRNGVSRG